MVNYPSQILEEKMQEFKELIQIADTLNSPEGCPWDIEQSFESLRPYILEEAHEALEAIDSGNDQEIIEELGDLFYTVVFYAKVAEREDRFSMKHIIDTLKEKLIRRHPHVFGDTKAKNMDDVIHNWEKIKKEEKQDRVSALDGIPRSLPSLLRAYKILKKMKKCGYKREDKLPQKRSEELATEILKTIESAISENIDIESSFRELLSEKEKAFKAWELQSTKD